MTTLRNPTNIIEDAPDTTQSSLREKVAHIMLRPLSPKVLQPARVSIGGQFFLQLKKIERIGVYPCVSKKKKRYIIHIFMEGNENRIPTNNQHCRSRQQRTITPANSSLIDNIDCASTIYMQRSLMDFRTLRWQLYDTAYRAHTCSGCSFCRDVMQYALAGFSYPGVWCRWFVKEQKMLESLSIFLNELLRLMLTCTTIEGTRCIGQETISLLVFEFLLEREQQGDTQS